MGLTNKKQWEMILGSVFIQGIILILLSFIDDQTDFYHAFAVSFIVLLLYLPIWLLLKVDIISKILLSKFVVGLVVVSWFILIITGYTSDLGFFEVTLIGAWIAMVLFVPFFIAEIELGISSSKISSTPNPKAAYSPTPTSKPKSTSTVETKSEDFYVECLNCGVNHTNPTNSLCTNCGKNMYVQDTNKKCKSCGMEYESSESTCPYCGTSS